MSEIFDFDIDFDFRMEHGMLKVNSAHPGIPFQYSTDEGVTWKVLKSHAKLSGNVYVATSSYDGKRRSRVIKVKS